jgi:hypothetical protein
VSDSDALEWIQSNYHVTENYEDAVALAANAGIYFCWVYCSPYYYYYLKLLIIFFVMIFIYLFVHLLFFVLLTLLLLLFRIIEYCFFYLFIYFDSYLFIYPSHDVHLYLCYVYALLYLQV